MVLDVIQDGSQCCTYSGRSELSSTASSGRAVMQVLEQDTAALAARVATLPFEDSRGQVSELETANRGLPASSRSTAPRDHT